MPELEVIAQELKLKEQFIPGYARTADRRALKRIVGQYNSEVEFLRQFNFPEPMYRFAPVGTWAEVAQQRERPLGVLARALYSITRKSLDFFMGNSYLLPEYEKECCYCGSEDYEVLGFQEEAHLVCKDAQCFERFYSYFEKKKKEAIQRL